MLGCYGYWKAKYPQSIITYYCYISAHYHPNNIIWNVAKNPGLRYLIELQYIIFQEEDDEEDEDDFDPYNLDPYYAGHGMHFDHSLSTIEEVSVVSESTRAEESSTKGNGDTLEVFIHSI